ncbi:MAG: hypothetical protein INR65_08350 [Gluconacetobacter diazotrophicus]|nr:hypothetical protein [Gluconacetobacter diazotrophicus]
MAGNGVASADGRDAFPGRRAGEQAGRNLPLLGTAGTAYRLLWENGGLHAKAVWPPVVFLVAAEVIYHRMVGQAHGIGAKAQAVWDAPWWMPVLAVFCWLAGLKFLLSFSISWRRHLMLGERFDPFFFKAPFWRYLAFLVLTYCWGLPVMLLALLPAGVAGLGGWLRGAGWLALAPAVVAAVVVLWGIVRQVPFFTALCLDAPRPGWRRCVRAMRGMFWRYAAIFVLAMAPVVAANAALDALLGLAGADPHRWAVALGEAAFRQAMLFVHFSLGASIGMQVFRATVGNEAER